MLVKSTPDREEEAFGFGERALVNPLAGAEAERVLYGCEDCDCRGGVFWAEEDRTIGCAGGGGGGGG